MFTNRAMHPHRGGSYSVVSNITNIRRMHRVYVEFTGTIDM